MATAKSFEDLQVWQQGRSIRKQLYGIARALPDHERYNLSTQIRTAAVSLTANIAEGFGRYHYKENLQFCPIARGSACEILDHLTTCLDEGYIEAERYHQLQSDVASFLRLLNGYIKDISERIP